MVTKDFTPDLKESELIESYDRLKIKYRDRLKQILIPISEELKSFSWFCSKPSSIEDGQYVIAVSRDPKHVERDGDPDYLDVEISVHMLESEDWSNVRGGADFRITIVSYEGEKLGSFPFTPEFMPDLNKYDNWVGLLDEYMMEERLKNLETLEPYKIVLLLQKWMKGKAAR